MNKTLPVDHQADPHEMTNLAGKAYPRHGFFSE